MEQLVTNGEGRAAMQSAVLQQMSMIIPSAHQAIQQQRIEVWPFGPRLQQRPILEWDRLPPAAETYRMVLQSQALPCMRACMSV